MDSDGGGLRAPERYLAGLCPLALADGNLGYGQGRDIHLSKQHRVDAGYAEVLNNHSSACGRGWRDTETDRGTDYRWGDPGLSAAEGVCL